jgi:hypothetical protein
MNMNIEQIEAIFNEHFAGEVHLIHQISQIEENIFALTVESFE